MHIRIITILLAAPVLLRAEEAIDPARAANTVILDEVRVQNLGIETAEAEETDFEETVFALGRVEAIPARRSGVSSRAAGRIVELNATVGDAVEAGVEVAKLESRQPGSPPPVIPIKTAGRGIVTKSNVALGEPLEPEQTLMEITDLDEVYAIARVPEHQAGRLKAGTVAHIRLPAVPEEKFDGELLRFGTEADRASGTVDAIFKLQNPNLTIRPGMLAEFSIVLSTREGVLSVPRAALQGDAANRYVFVKDSDPRMKFAYVKSPVVIGQMNTSLVEIVSGILVADEVVTRGAYSLAFAGGGSVSLREALDAAHGHEHNEDGSELTPAQKAAQAAKGGGDEAHAHEDSGGMIWKVSTGVLAALLVFTTLKKRGPGDDEKPGGQSPQKPQTEPKPEAI
jgi:cobalt-zinc-cadmium efflux system membrane fusion protein